MKSIEVVQSFLTEIFFLSHNLTRYRKEKIFEPSCQKKIGVVRIKKVKYTERKILTSEMNIE
jgi:hypothetical protein